MSDTPAFTPLGPEASAAMTGKYILIGLSYYDHRGQETDRIQMHGVITSASSEGVLVELKGTRSGTSWNAPPFSEAIRPAKAGNYTLHSTQEIIENPDFLCTWAIHSPPPKA